MQAITDLKPNGAIIGREVCEQIFSAFYDAFDPITGVVVRFRPIQNTLEIFLVLFQRTRHIPRLPQLIIHFPLIE